MPVWTLKHLVSNQIQPENMWFPSCPTVSTVKQQLEAEWKVYADVNTDPVPNATVRHPLPSPHFGDLMPDRLSGNSPLMQALQTYKHISTLLKSEMLRGTPWSLGYFTDAFKTGPQLLWGHQMTCHSFRIKKYINIVYIIIKIFFPHYENCCFKKSQVPCSLLFIN